MTAPKQNLKISAIPAIAALAAGAPDLPARTFAQDIELMRRHTEIVLLSNTTGTATAQVAVAPAWQGRVMTSSFDGDFGESLGWINEKAITAPAPQPRINLYGGEDRFWLGPEGGQFGLFFAPGSAFDLEHWQTPPLIDTEPFEKVSASPTEALFRRDAELVNRAGTKFKMRIDRSVRLLGSSDLRMILGGDPPAGVKVVSYETVNTVTNTSDEPWRKENGLISIWILGMYPASDGTTVAIPVKPEAGGIQAVNDNYFAPVGPERLRALGNAVFFRADGNYRSKIGVPPQRATPRLGSYDPARKILTIVDYSLPEGVSDYVDSSWKEQEKPFAGDVINAYNDGPPTPGAGQLGKFYELESSSPALALQPNQSHTHTHRTFHLHGEEEALDLIARQTLGISIVEIKNAFSQ